MKSITPDKMIKEIKESNQKNRSKKLKKSMKKKLQIIIKSSKKILISMKMNLKKYSMKEMKNFKI